MTALFLVARIAGRPVAIDAHHVDAVVDVTDLVAIPRADATVLGLTALRSRVVTVIDTALALGLPATPPGGHRAITARIDGHYYGFVVEAVDDVAAFEPLPLSVGLALAGGWREAARGLIERDREPVLILDLSALLPATPSLAA